MEPPREYPPELYVVLCVIEPRNDNDMYVYEKSPYFITVDFQRAQQEYNNLDVLDLQNKVHDGWHLLDKILCVLRRNNSSYVPTLSFFDSLQQGPGTPQNLNNAKYKFPRMYLHHWREWDMYYLFGNLEISSIPDITTEIPADSKDIKSVPIVYDEWILAE